MLYLRVCEVSEDCHVYSFPVGTCLVNMEDDKNTKTVSKAERNVGKRGGSGGGGEAKGRGGSRNGRKRAKTIDQQPEDDEEPETVPAVEEAKDGEEVKATTTVAAESEDVTDTKDISDTKEGADQAKKKPNSARKKIAKRELSCIEHPTAVFKDISDLRWLPLSFLYD